MLRKRIARATRDAATALEIEIRTSTALPSGIFPALVLRRVLHDGTSPGADVLVENGAAWPEFVTHPDGPTLLAYTAVDGSPDSGMLRARIVTLTP